MKYLFKSLFVFLFVFLTGFLFISKAQAFAFNLQGKVTDDSSAGIYPATIDVFDTGTQTVEASTTTDSSGNYSLPINQGTYDIKVTPPGGSNFSPAIALNRTIASDTILNFILVNGSSVSLSGHVYDALGNPVVGQHVELAGSLGDKAVTTDSGGNYLLKVLPGTYIFFISGQNNASDPDRSSLSVPDNYSLENDSYSINQNTVLDITVPAKKVTVNVQDASNSALSNIGLGASFNFTRQNTFFNIGGGVSMYGTSFYNNNTVTTGSLGSAVLWLFPTTNSTYNITAFPPTGTNYPQTTLRNISITDNATETITLLAPVTLSGHVYDALGNPVVGQHVELAGSLGDKAVTTDSGGNYLLNVLPGTYILLVSGQNNASDAIRASLSIPDNYSLENDSYTINQNTTLDITVPAKKVSVHVQDAISNPVINIAIAATFLSSDNQRVNDHLTIQGVGTMLGADHYNANQVFTDSLGNVTLWLLPTDTSINSSYKLTAIPPSGSIYPQTTVSNISITDETSEFIILPTPVSLTGHIYDALGNPVVGQHVELAGSLGDTVATTDSGGNYSLHVLAGSYDLHISGQNNASDPDRSSLSVPDNYLLDDPSYSINKDTNLDISIPAKKVLVHVQDAANNPVSNIGLGASFNFTRINTEFTIGGNITVNGTSFYNNGTVTTSLSGDAVLWLFPSMNSTYKFTAFPPSGSIYTQTILDNISIIDNTNEIISLQFSHAHPTTTATLSPDADSSGNYSNPTTVTISAIAASGYTIANIYYTIDGGSQQKYSVPFTVSGSGSHTITYWSIDNSGVFEAPNTKTFTIRTNQPPSINSLSDATINEGDTFTQIGSFTDSDSTSWTATVDYGDGSGINPLTLNSDKTFNLSHVYKDEGTYTVAVAVVDNQGASSSVSVTVTVNNAPMTVSSITAPTDPQQVNTQVSATATFTDPGVLDTHTATITWGDGHTTTCTSTSTSECTLTEPNGSTPGLITANHTYTSASVNSIVLTVTDDDGVHVSPPPFQYLVVYDPSAGFLTASGKYTTQAGWDLLNPSAAGEVKFGISSQYQTGASIPTGNTKVMFKIGDLSFQSTSYSWMVVSSNLAYLMGTGTVANSTDTYNLFVSVDSSAQTIRFQLRDNTTQDIVYDTQPNQSTLAEPTTTLTSGSIKIH